MRKKEKIFITVKHLQWHNLSTTPHVNIGFIPKKNFRTTEFPLTRNSLRDREFCLFTKYITNSAVLIVSKHLTINILNISNLICPHPLTNFTDQNPSLIFPPHQPHGIQSPPDLIKDHYAIVRDAERFYMLPSKACELPSLPCLRSLIFPVRQAYVSAPNGCFAGWRHYWAAYMCYVYALTPAFCLIEGAKRMGRCH